MNITHVPQKKHQKAEENVVIFSPLIKIDNNTNLSLLSIHLDDEYTRIDFLYQASNYYINGGWVQIDKDSFIRAQDTKTKLKLIKAVNIPIAPNKHFFKSTKDMLAYTLYFPSLPKNTHKIDIIEKELPGKEWFNFYDVSITKINQEVLIVNN